MSTFTPFEIFMLFEFAILEIGLLAIVWTLRKY